MIFVYAWALAALTIPGYLGAQEAVAAGEEESVYIETVDVTVVNIDVYVTDKKGNPISGLTKEDFELLEEGRPVPISNFYAVQDGRPIEPTRQAEEPETSVPDRDTAKPAPVPEDQRLHLVVYIDNHNIRPWNRNRVFRRLREFLRTKLDSEDRVMLVSYDRSLNIRFQFTSDSQLIASALFELENLSGLAVHNDSERRELLDYMEDERVRESTDISWRIRQYAESLRNDLAFTIDALKEMIGWLGGLPGRKAILYVSDGLPLIPGEDLFYAVSEVFQDTSVLTMAQEFNSARRFQELAAAANSNRVTFYTIDAAGLRAPQASSVEQATVGQLAVKTLVDSIYVSNLQQPLILIAESTGGQAIYNANDVGPLLERVASDFDTYYSLGYSPAHSGSGRYYKLKVQVKRKGLKVRHREGYRDKPLPVRMEEGTQSTLLFGFEQNPLGVNLRVGSGDRIEADQYEVNVLVGIPIGSITLVPQDEFHLARVKLYFQAMDEGGRFSEVQELSLPIEIANDELDFARERLYIHKNTMMIRKGPHRLAVGLWDEIGGVGSFVTKGVAVGDG
jgi:VWFA-related protein